MKILPLSLSFISLLVVSLLYGGQEWTPVSGLIDPEWSPLIWDLRMPRALTAGFTGGALALAGVMTQGLFQNPLACPSLLGVGTGGALAALLVLYFVDPILSLLWLPIASGIGSFLVLLMLLAPRNRREGTLPSALLLQGMSLNAFLGATISALLTFAWETPNKGQSMLHWLVGGFARGSYEGAWGVLSAMLAATYLAKGLGAQLDILTLGSTSAQALGVCLKKTQQRTVLAVALLVGTSVAVAGPLPFIGILVPHFCRALGILSHGELMRWSFFVGGSFTLMMDLLARTLFYPREIETGVIISLLGGGIFFWLCRRAQV